MQTFYAALSGRSSARICVLDFHNLLFFLVINSPVGQV